MNLQETLNACASKTVENIRQMGTQLYEYPGVLCTDGRYFEDQDGRSLRPLGHIFCWTQGFFAGMAGISWQVTGKEELLRWLYSLYPQFYDKVFRFRTETMHDLGFLYSPYAVMIYRMRSDEKLRELGLQAARVLADRYMKNGSYIRAWGRMDDQIPEYVDRKLAEDHFFTQSRGLAIIDSMMNLPLLFWASENGGGERCRQIAKAHADTTMKYFIREDDSVYHAYRFDAVTGEALGGENFCGYGRKSHWARGTAWAMYGFAIAFRYTGEERYLDVARRLTIRYLECVGEHGIPVWDFCLPADTPALPCGNMQAFWDVTKRENVSYVADTSAAAVAVCALQEISSMTGDDVLHRDASRTLQVLAEEYFNPDPKVNGMLHHSNGQMGYTVFGDFFFMEALAREVCGISGCW